jgi:transcriptional regulator
MYQPSHFIEARGEVLRALVRERPLGTLITLDGAGALQADAVPFLLEPGPTPLGSLRGHVARANGLWRETNQAVEALVQFQGEQGYISPAWYPSKAEHGKVVPTWNYIVVQARGRLRVIDDPHWLRALVGRLTTHFESRRAVGDAAPAWHVEDAPPDFVAAMLRAIVGIEIELTALTGKYKLSQNRSAADRDGAIAGVRSLDAALAQAMTEAARPPG